MRILARQSTKGFLAACATALLLLAAPLRGEASAPVLQATVVARYPHSTEFYTEGFLYLNGLFYEGTGLEHHSGVRVTDPASGRLLQRADLGPEYFGEGIVDWGPNLYQWTWKSHTCFVLDRFSLRVLSRFDYEGEGWGMTRTARELITSDGTAVLRFRDPKTFHEIRRLPVHDGPVSVEQLNELEFIAGEIYANVWHSDRIARISPKDGHVIAWIDLAGLLPDSQKLNSESVLNGIAYDAEHKRLFVTGKQWPTIFEIKIATGGGRKP